METAVINLASALADDLDTAFPDLVRSRQNQIFGGVMRIVRHHADAADITQETFIRAYRALAGYDNARIEALKLDGWLWTIAINLCRNSARRKNPVPSQLPDQASLEPGPESAAIASAEAATWDTRLARLTATQRSAVVLRHVVGLSYDEISQATGRPAGTVKADVHRGIARLRRILEAEATQ